MKPGNNALNIWLPRLCSVFVVIVLVAVMIPETNQPAFGVGNESELHGMRSQSEITSGTLLLKSVDGVVEEGVLTFDQMKQTELKSTPPPVFIDEVNAMDGQEITIRGFMTPFDSLTNFNQFMIFPNATGCQFCAVPSPKEVVFVRLKDDTQPFISEPIEVTGTLSLWGEGKDKEEEAHRSFLFVMKDAEVKAIRN